MLRLARAAWTAKSASQHYSQPSPLRLARAAWTAKSHKLECRPHMSLRLARAAWTAKSCAYGSIPAGQLRLARAAWTAKSHTQSGDIFIWLRLARAAWTAKSEANNAVALPSCGWPALLGLLNLWRGKWLEEKGKSCFLPHETEPTPPKTGGVGSVFPGSIRAFVRGNR